ncbi:hypothetical protein LTR36_002836 [Oleoguttula mirabilis]|uniref:Uncharacterized protein n=1 Tax=Oleoguttula mirabilis TaxID=1507867 RepID=A0AAV9JJL2_9PEZI|nr:hypothetical protein LTR36_002836 [Oleoguttula mirabilis]
MPRGSRPGLIGLISSGVGAAAEYREHRKEQKLSREDSHQNDEVVAGPSTTPQQQVRQAPPTFSSEPPPSYAELEAGPVDRSLARGAPASDEKKGGVYDEESSEDDDSDSDLESLEDDEEDWELDEALEKTDSRNLPSYDESEAEFRTTDELVQDVLVTSRAATEQRKVRQPLPCPVILPQRRPRKKARGFVRAYAPVLANSGIDQATFLSFLKSFHQSSQASPVFTVIQVSAAIAGFAPGLIAMAVTTAVQVAAGVGEEIQARQRTNNFLGEMNEKLFQPAGLYAFIMKYKPDADVTSSQTGIAARFGLKPQVVDMSTNQVIAKYYRSISDDDLNDGGNRSMSDRLKAIRLASGTTQGTIQLPRAAPLIFPAIDKAVARDGAEETFKDKAKDAKKFLGDYLDRRAQTQYARDEPTSNLAVPEEARAFKSKLADPNHPAYQGGLVGLVTGGAVSSPRADKRERRSERRFGKDERRVLRYERRMDQGRDLSRLKQSRYNAFTSELERRGGGLGGGLGGRLGGGRQGFGHDDGNAYDDQAGFGRNRSRSGGRRGGGLLSGLVGAAVHAASIRGSSNESAPTAPHGGSGSRSRDYEDVSAGRNGASAIAPAGLYNGGRRQRRGDQRGGGGPVGMVKRMMREDVLYLMIVNLPSEQELAEAREELARQKAQ